MKDTRILTLDNGLKVILLKDTSKKAAILDLIVKFGGKDTEYMYDNKHYHISNGIAHFMEHLLIEHSMYGNMLPLFMDNYINFNGLTYAMMTNFYIDTVHDFNKNLVKLLKGINNRVFTENDVEETKNAILEEIRENLDNKFRKLDILTRNCLFQNLDYKDILGTLQEIENVTYEELVRCYEVFYKPSNQIVVVSGNFDEEKVLELIKKTYDEFNYSNHKTSIIIPNEAIEVKEKEGEVQVETEEDYVRVSYKIKLNHLNSYERVRLSFYLKYLFSYNFSTKSKLQKDILDKEISIYDLDIDYYFINDMVILEFGTYTSKKDELVKLIQDKIKNLEFDLEDFEMNKKDTIISLILREENLNSLVFPLVENIVTFNYFDIDKIKDVENETFENYKEIINSLDFTNYTVTSAIKG